MESWCFAGLGGVRLDGPRCCALTRWLKLGCRGAAGALWDTLCSTTLSLLSHRLTFTICASKLLQLCSSWPENVVAKLLWTVSMDVQRPIVKINNACQWGIIKSIYTKVQHSPSSIVSSWPIRRHSRCVTHPIPSSAQAVFNPSPSPELHSSISF